MPFQLSPGVAVVEKDFTSIVPAVATSIGAHAGAFAWGPVMEPNTVSSENELVRRFGKPNDNNFQSFFSAANFLSYTNNLLLVRTDGTAARNAVSTKTGGVTSTTITDAGSGYGAGEVPDIAVSAPNEDGGVQAVMTAVMSGGGISAIAVTSGGSGYDVANTTVTVTGGGGSGAAVSVVVDSSGTITAFQIDTAGTGYTSAPTITVGGSSGGTGAVAGAVTLGAATLTGITIDTAGTGYVSAPTVTIDAPVGGGDTATATATITSAGVKINNTEDYLTNYSNGAGVVGEWAARYPGYLGNSLTVSIADYNTWDTWTTAYKAEFDAKPGTSPYSESVNAAGHKGNDELHVIIVDTDGLFTGTRGAVLEKFPFVSKASDAKKSDGTNNYYKDVVNTRSEYVYWMDHPSAVAVTVQGAGTTGDEWGQSAAGNTFKDLIVAGGSATEERTWKLSGGVDDYSGATTDSSKMNGFAEFINSERYDISLIVAGKASTTVANYLIQNIAETRLDCVAFVSPENTTSGDMIQGNTSTQITAINTYRDALTSSSYGVMDSGFKYQYDRYNDKYRWVPLNADTAGLAARTDYTNDAWWSPAGLSRGQIKSVVRLAVNPSKTQRDELYKNGVNPVVAFPGEGTVLFGDKTLLAKPSAFDRINVRRLFIVLEKAIATASKYQLFEFNDSFTRAQFKNLVEPFLRDIQGRRGITDFVVKCDESNNTGEVIDRNEFVADIFVKPTRSINFITLNFVAARSGINFSEVGA